jgi:uncharacterized integral membrane protein
MIGLKYYRLWVIAFLLKFIGSAWDASYHFKYLFEEYSIPHIVNTLGFALGGILLVTNGEVLLIWMGSQGI